MEIESLVKLIQTVSESDLTGFKYEENGIKLNIQKEKASVWPALSQEESAAADGEKTVLAARPEMPEASKETGALNEGKLVKSPLVGTFYAAPSEEAKPFVAVGDPVKKGQIVAIVEAMKLMNDIESEFDGTVVEVLAENGESVEYGQPLFRIA